MLAHQAFQTTTGINGATPMETEFPSRPDTPDSEAILAMERIVLYLLRRVARFESDDGPAVWLDRVRTNLTSKLSELPPTVGGEQLVLDHVDWLLATASHDLPER